jgi:hypothetical protein
LALVALALSASPASASALEIRRGSLVLRWGRRVYSRVVRFGPLLPAERRVVSIRLLRPLPRHCVRARVTTRRDDIPASTELRFAVHRRLP